ncbi:hypothetical protein E2320_020353 [Naja naja]|nr:hypothetical protein E2320_020353 [Naja naja]
MRDLRLQRKLIAKKIISLKKVIEEAQAAEISDKPATKIENSKSIHSAWGTTSKYQGKGEIGELSEEEEEIHIEDQGPKGQARDPCGMQSAADAREGGILLKHAEQICQHTPIRVKQVSLMNHVVHNKGDSRDRHIQTTGR